MRNIRRPFGKLNEKKLSWYGHVMREDVNHLTKGMLNWKVDGYKSIRKSPIKEMGILCEG